MSKTKNIPGVALIALVSSVLTTGPLSAATAQPELSEAAYFEDLPVVLTASRLAQPQSEAPNAITVIDRKMIEASGVRTIPELLRLVPGMYVGFVDANRPVISLHGSVDEFARRMQVLIDGRSIYMAPFGTVSWADLPIQFEEVESIEVVRGPSSASHGSNAFYGTINIITRDWHSLDSNAAEVRFGAAKDAAVTLRGGADTWGYRLSAGVHSDNGLENGVLNDYSNTRKLRLRFNWRVTPQDELEVQLGHSQGRYGLGIVGRPEDAFREISSSADFQLVRWDHAWTGSDETKITLSRTSRRKMDPYLCVDSNACQYHEREPQTYPTDGFASQSDNNRRIDLEVQNTHQLGANHRVVWGGGTRTDYANYSLFLEQPTTVQAWRVFGHDEWRITPSAVLNTGVMHESDGYGNTTNSPRLALSYHLARDHTLRLAWSTATRSPVMLEAQPIANNTVLGGLFVPPLTKLTPEVMESREIGYIGHFPELQSTLDVRLYVENVRDQIWYDKLVVVTNNPGNRDSPDSFKNLFDAQYRGLEMTLKRKWDSGRSFATLNYAYQEASAALSSLPTQYNSTAPFPGFASWGAALHWYYDSQYLALYPGFVPKHTMSALVSKAFGGGWQLSGAYYFRTEMRVSDVAEDVTPETVMHRLDVKVAKTFTMPNGAQAQWYAVMQNATRDSYTKYGTVNAVADVPFERRGWIGLKLNF